MIAATAPRAIATTTTTATRDADGPVEAGQRCGGAVWQSGVPWEDLLTGLRAHDNENVASK